MGINQITMYDNYRYIGSSPEFNEGDKVRIIKGHTFLIKELLQDGLISYDAEYTFVKYDGYGCGNNYCVLGEIEYSLPEHCLEKF